MHDDGNLLTGWDLFLHLYSPIRFSCKKSPSLIILSDIEYWKFYFYQTSEKNLTVRLFQPVSKTNQEFLQMSVRILKHEERAEHCSVIKNNDAWFKKFRNTLTALTDSFTCFSNDANNNNNNNLTDVMEFSSPPILWKLRGKWRHRAWSLLPLTCPLHQVT